MIDENIIKSAKAVDISKILNEFNWHTDETGTFILCPSPQHDDKHPSVVINKAGNYCRCFTCRNGIGSDFDTINVYRNLSEKVNHIGSFRPCRRRNLHESGRRWSRPRRQG